MSYTPSSSGPFLPPPKRPDAGSVLGDLAARFPQHSPLYPLFMLAKELEARGIYANIDGSVGVVDAYVPDISRFGHDSYGTGEVSGPGCDYKEFQRAILRPDPVTCRPWWWLLWPGERFKAERAEPEVTRLLPVEDTPETARRIRNILILDSTDRP